MTPSPADPTDPELQASGRRNTAFWAVVIASLAVFALQIKHYYPFMADDAFISLRYSQNLLHGKGLVWNTGPRVEGYTNLLWVLLCALLGTLHVNLVTAARLLGVTCMLLVYAALAWHIRISFSAPQRLSASIAGLLPFAFYAPSAVWAIGGLEQPLLLAGLAWATVFTLRYFRTTGRSDLAIAGVLLSLVTLTRADGFLFALLFFAVMLVSGLRLKQPPAAAFFLVLPAGAAFFGQLVFRRLYYAEWVPNTAYVKVSFTLHRVLTGFVYVWNCLAMEPLLLLLALSGCIILARRKQNAACLLLATVPSLYAGYLMIVGGDIFPAARHFLPATLMFCFAAAEVGRAIADRKGNSRLTSQLLLTLCAISLIHSREGSRNAETERWEWQGRSLGLFFKTAFEAKHPLLVADPAGAVPFYSELNAIDPLGLNDSHISHHYSVARGQQYLGHELADGKYVLDHKPDLIVFAEPTGSRLPVFNSDHEIVADPRFARFYRLVTFHITGAPSLDSLVYVRALDGPLGVQVAADRITIPAYLANVSADAYVSGSVNGDPALTLPPRSSAEIIGLPIPSGKWKISSDTPDATYSTGELEIASTSIALTSSFRVKNLTHQLMRIHTIYLNRSTP